MLRLQTRDVMQVLANAMVVIILQCVSVSNQCIHTLNSHDVVSQ